MFPTNRPTTDLLFTKQNVNNKPTTDLLFCGIIIMSLHLFAVFLR